MAKTLVKLFNTESYAGGGTYFADGPYRIDEARFVLFDFNGKAPGATGDGLVCLRCNLQQLNKEGKDVGEVSVQYWSAGDGVAIENKGKSITLTGQYATIWALSDLAIFIEHLGKAGFDRDEHEDSNDISELDGLVFEFGKIPSPRTGGKVKMGENGKPLPPPHVIVPVSVVETSGGKAAAKGGSKAAAAPAAAAASSSSDAEEVLSAYLEDAICVDGNAKKGVEKLQSRLGIKKWVVAKGWDEAVAESVTKLFKDDSILGAMLNNMGWEIDGSKIKKAA